VFYVLQYMFFPGQSVYLVSRIDGTKDPLPSFISSRLRAAAGMFPMNDIIRAHHV
jgi:hypothetical protein